METLAILDQIETLVSDQLDVVSYKWLSRNFLVSSNAAKRLLQEFVDKHRTGLEVVYALSGWLKNNPQCYHIKLVTGLKLEEAKQEFDGNCSVHVYSVQVAIPNDLAALWNDEFIQAEQLFKQPSAVDNCLRDNRFCGILNPFVKRNVDRASVSNAAPQPKSVEISGPSTSNFIRENIKVDQKIKVGQSGPEVLQSMNSGKDVITENHGIGVHNQALNPPVDREKVPPLPGNEKKGMNNKNSTGNGGSLASLWGRASTKSKLTSAPAENSLTSNPTASAEAQICALEAIEDQSSDDEVQGVNFRRSSNGEGGRKRRVVLDYSDDECEDVVNLASPDLPKGKISKTSLSEKLNFNEQTEDKMKVKEEKSTDRASNQASKENSSVASKSINLKDSSKEKINNHITGGDVKADIVTNAAPNSPKRRKVLKTHIDDRGREVNEVVWEGEETETKKDDSNVTKEADSVAMKKAESNAVTNNRAPEAKKSPDLGNTVPSNPGGKAGNKKGSTKDPKQGNLLSFFKRV